MRAHIEERLSTQPIAARTKSEKTTWQDIAIGIFVGGFALMVTWTVFDTIRMNYEIRNFKIELRNFDQQLNRELNRIR